MLSYEPQNDIAAMLRRKSQLQGDAGKSQANRVTLEKARLVQARTLALRRNDKEEAAMFDAQLAELAVESSPAKPEPTEDASALLAKVNERNRKANQGGESAARNYKRPSVSARERRLPALPSWTPMGVYARYHGCLIRGTDTLSPFSCGRNHVDRPD